MRISERLAMGQVVRKIRKRLGLRQVEFGERFSVSQSVVSEWEAGTRNPSKTVVVGLMEIAEGTENQVLSRAIAKRTGSAKGAQERNPLEDELGRRGLQPLAEIVESESAPVSQVLS